jgi:hypothetical protein
MGYVTFKTIGESGNLASQLQQYASLYAISKETNREIIFPESCTETGYGFKFAELLGLSITVAPEEYFNTFVDIRPNENLIVDTNVFRLDPNINYNIVNRFDLFHYWYPKYYNDIMEWKWNPLYHEQAVKIYNTIKTNNKELVSIHVRRGDYLLPQHQHFCQLDTGYYEEALQPFIKEIDKYHFVIFSNDIEWCKANLIEGDSVTFIEPGVDYVDLILMSMCDHNIIANSSYSWWAAFKNKNKNKIVTCPVNYLRGNMWSHINGNYYPSSWTAINNI